jgi:NAD+ synthase (glutamine-hydrolysing)
VKIALAQINLTIGDLDGNVIKMVEAIDKAAGKAELIVFSELAICGYIPKDKLNYESFIAHCDEAIESLIPHSKKIGIIVGAPRRSGLTRGKSLYNSAIVMDQGAIVTEVRKTLLPTYDIFDEHRFFEPNSKFELVRFRGSKIALTICEDLWNLNRPWLYSTTPMDELVKLEPDFMINISGSPYSYNHVEERRNRMVGNAKKYALPLIYVNQVGAHTDIIFDGGSMFIDKYGTIAEELETFESDFTIVDCHKDQAYEAQSKNHKDSDIGVIHKAIICGIKDYFNKMGFKKAILGASGGIDSALVNALAVEALGAENVTSILMPSKYSSEGSITDAVNMCKLTGNKYKILPINEMVAAAESSLSELFSGMKSDVTEENIQARCRGLLLMACSNKFGHMLLNTSNKSETAVGYSTLYGDMCGGLSPIGDLYKTQVYEMSNYINRQGIIIPIEIINKPPSAELRPNQKDSDSLPSYDELDSILLHYVEEQKGWEEIVALGFDEPTVRKIVQMVDKSEYKRFQAPPILRISFKSFGLGRQMPLVAKYFN